MWTYWKKNNIGGKLVIQKQENIPKPEIWILYSHRLKKPKDEKIFNKFMEIFKKLQINIMVGKALEQMSTYEKFMKDIISKKRSIKDETNVLSEKCNAILQRYMEIKKKDLWSDIIPCTIGDKKFNKVLMDLDTSVCLTPLSIYKTMDIWIISQKIMTLQFSNNFVNHPYGIVEYVLVKIYKFVFLVDSYVL